MELKRGIFFSADALIALVIIFVVILIAYPLTQIQRVNTELNSDFITSLSSIKIGEVDNPYVQQLIIQGIITNVNQSFLEGLAEIYISNPEAAQEVLNYVLDDISTNENIGIWIDDQYVASKNTSSFEDAENIQTARQVVSGVKQGEAITGFSSRASLSSKLRSSYFYFGGYVGDGNISSSFYINGTVNNAMFEVATNKNFTVFLNNQSLGVHQGSPNEFTPVRYSLPSNLFLMGNNKLELKADGLSIAGGFVKVSYQSQEVTFSQNNRQNLPGIRGIINLYDGLTIPGNLGYLKLHLRIKSNSTFFVKVGNVQVYSGQTNGFQNITLDNSQLVNLLNYSKLSFKTTPFRIGLSNISYFSNKTKNLDVFSVTDLSGSMVDGCSGGSFWCCLFNNQCSSQNSCLSCGGTWQQKLGLAKQANNLLIDNILNSTGNRVGLVGYKDTAADSNYHNLSNSISSLKTKVTQWTVSGNTCICCGVNKAAQNYNLTSDRLRAMVVLSDGVANVQCPEQGTGNPRQDSIESACDAYQNRGITVHTVGFGDDADESTLQAMAACGNGSYFFANVNEILTLYQQISNELIKGTYSEQRVEINGSVDGDLSSDSYIEFNYTGGLQPYGLILSEEQQFTTPYYGSFSKPNGSSILEARVFSYSGPRWTNNVSINGNNFYSLSDHGSNYTTLGDPYSILIPNNLINSNNVVNLTTAISPLNFSEGSIYNKIIYSFVKNLSGFSPIAANANGCSWTVQFEDYSNTTFEVPSSYNGSNTCAYQQNNIIYSVNDAIQTAVYNLLTQLDIDFDGKVDVEFSEQDLEISTNEITGIPFPWSSEFQVRIWR